LWDRKRETRFEPQEERETTIGNGIENRESEREGGREGGLEGSHDLLNNGGRDHTSSSVIMSHSTNRGTNPTCECCEAHRRGKISNFCPVYLYIIIVFY
jgi:hypothetical protein